MNFLPYEVIVKILGYLDVNSRIDLRMVSKKLKMIVDNQKITNLRITDSNVEILENYFLINDPVLNSDLLLMVNSQYLNSFVMKSITLKVKRAYIDLGINGKDGEIFNVINDFENLEQLQCPYLKYFKIFTLKLDKLKILSIDNLSTYTNYPLRLATPLLESFKTKSCLSDFNFSYPNSIVHLSLNRIRYLDQCQMFKLFYNIELFYLKHCDTFSLDHFPRLSELHFSAIKNKVLSNLLDQKLSLKNFKLQFFFNGMRIDSNDEIMAINSCEKTYTDKILLNYSKTSKALPWITDIDYIMALNSNNLKTIPSDFFKKAINIREIIVTQNVEENPFLQFVRNCMNLEKLDLNASFSQSFYNNLVLYSPLLSIIHINETKEIQMDFLSRFLNLQEIKYNKNIQFATIMKIFQQVIFLIEIEFVFKNEFTISIKVEESNCKNYFVKLQKKTAIFRSKNVMCNFFENLLS